MSARRTPFTNLDGTTPAFPVRDLLKWNVVDVVTGRRPRHPPKAAPARANDGRALAASAPHLTWIGHSTFVQRLGGRLVATDPIWSTRIATVPRAGAPGVPLERVPPIDVVTISHSHYDHLDMPTLRRIGPTALYVVPRGLGDLLVREGLSRVVELDWWQTHREGELSITLVPAQHWSMRTPWDRNRTLWGGFVFASPEATTYHAGDTAFSERVFSAIAERCPRVDWAMLPIGAYEPTWFMKKQHMGPEDAGRAWEILGARHLVAMHWGTFKLTDEPMTEPPQRLRAWWTSRGHDPARCWILDVGETRPLRAHPGVAPR